MAKIAILDDSPEVVALLAHALTPREHTIMKMVDDTGYMVQRVIAFQPDLILIPLYRKVETANRPLRNYREEVDGAQVLSSICEAEALKHVPIILLAFFTTPEDMPEDYRLHVRFREFLTFPAGLQDLNPLISALTGPTKEPRA